MSTSADAVLFLAKKWKGQHSHVRVYCNQSGANAQAALWYLV